MRVPLPMLLLALAVAPLAASAQDGDAAYCASLSALVSRYIASGTQNGGNTQDLDTYAALADCRNGKAAAAIPVLERKLRNNGFTLPKR